MPDRGEIPRLANGKSRSLDETRTNKPRCLDGKSSLVSDRSSLRPHIQAMAAHRARDRRGDPNNEPFFPLLRLRREYQSRRPVGVRLVRLRVRRVFLCALRRLRRRAALRQVPALRGERQEPYDLSMTVTFTSFGTINCCKESKAGGVRESGNKAIRGASQRKPK